MVCPMNNFKKLSIFFLFFLSLILSFSGRVNAQTWDSAMGTSINYCWQIGSNNLGSGYIYPNETGQCQCPQGYTLGTALNANCTMSGFIPGCWNPSTGKCNTCGEGGTIELGQMSCFSNGQSNSGGIWKGASGISCTGTYPSNYGGQSTQCVSSGTASGGFSTN
jgi:hypothetical protein